MDNEYVYYNKPTTKEPVMDEIEASLPMWENKPPAYKGFLTNPEEAKNRSRKCEGLRKHIANLKRRLLKHILANVILSIISVAAIIALFTLIQN